MSVCVCVCVCGVRPLSHLVYPTALENVVPTRKHDKTSNKHALLVYISHDDNDIHLSFYHLYCHAHCLWDDQNITEYDCCI